MDNESIKRQSEAAYNQWGEQWREQAKTHSKYEMKSLADFANHGVGRACLLVANGASFEDDVETIKKYRNHVDIMACDKTLGHLIDNGITPDFCLVCDANVDYERYMKPWEDKLEKVTLFMNVCANPKWTSNGDWCDKYFFVNEDVLKSHFEFGALSKCKNIIPAGTNVSNAMLVFLTQSNNSGRNNFFGYDKILLTGFDYCWIPGEHYYSFNEDGDGKASYMRHVYTVTNDYRFCYTSHNLQFSMQWVQRYISTFKLPVVQCSKSSILMLSNKGDLAEQMQYNYKQADRQKVRENMAKKAQLMADMQRIDANTIQMGMDHYYSFIRSV